MKKRTGIILLIALMIFNLLPINAYAYDGMSSIFCSNDTDNFNDNMSKLIFKIIKPASENKHGEVKVIGGYTNYDFERLEPADNIPEKHLVIPDMIIYNSYTYIVTTIGGAAFANTNLESIDFNDSLSTIEYSAFMNTNIVELDLKNIKEIDQTSFSVCNKISKISVNDSNSSFKVINGLLLSKDEKILYLISNSDKTEITLIEGIEIIKTNSFTTYINEDGSYDIVKITLPSTLKQIEEFAFDSKIIVFKGKNPPKISDNFAGRYIKVPEGSIKKYQQNLNTYKEKTFTSENIMTSIKNIEVNESFLKSISTKSFIQKGLKIPSDISKENYKTIQKFALELTKDCKKDEDKVKVIVGWISKEKFWNLDAFSKFDGLLLQVKGDYKEKNTYEAFKQKSLINSEFSNLLNVMLRSVGISSITISTEPKDSMSSDQWCINAAYYENSWHLIDIVNCTWNKFENGTYIKTDNLNFNKIYFDQSIELFSLKDEILYYVK